MNYIASFLLFLFCTVSVFAQSWDPLLTLDMYMHTAMIRRLSSDAQGKMILTCSDDKTAKVWNAESGELIKTLRVQIGDGPKGQLYACALSPDGYTAVVGGWTDYMGNKNYSLYVFDVKSNTVKKFIGDLPDYITDLEFSHNGKFLAAGFAGTSGVYVFQTSDWAMYKRISYYKGECNSVAFDKWGHLGTVCSDRKIRIYDKDFELIKESTGAARHPYSISFSPEGDLIAIGYKDTAFVHVLNRLNMKQLYVPSLAGISQHEEISNVTFSYDGTVLLGGGSYKQPDKDGYRKVRMWLLDKNRYQDIAVAANTITDIKPMPDNSFIYSASTPEFGRAAISGRIIFKDTSDVNHYNIDDKNLFKVNDNGSEIGITPYGKKALLYSVTGRLLEVLSSSGTSYTDSHGSVNVTGWLNAKPLVNSKPVRFLKPDERSYSVDISTDATQIVFGADRTLYCTDSSGTELWSVPAQGAVWNVVISGNGKVAVATLDDGIIRWYSMIDGKLLMSVYLHSDNKRWILWTPDGHFDCSDGAESLFGWQFNQGPYKEAQFKASDTYDKSMYTKDLGSKVLFD
jgi:WD40 repeat protein